MRDQLSNRKIPRVERPLLFSMRLNKTRLINWPIPFGNVARAVFSSQATSATAQNIFNDLGKNWRISEADALCEYIQINGDHLCDFASS